MPDDGRVISGVCDVQDHARDARCGGPGRAVFRPRRGEAGLQSPSMTVPLLRRPILAAAFNNAETSGRQGKTTVLRPAMHDVPIPASKYSLYRNVRFGHGGGLESGHQRSYAKAWRARRFFVFASDLGNRRHHRRSLDRHVAARTVHLSPLRRCSPPPQGHRDRWADLCHRRGGYAVLIAIVVVDVWETFTKGDEIATAEANKLSNLMLDSAGLPPAIAGTVRTDLN